MKSKKFVLILATLIGVAFTITLDAQLVADGDTVFFTGATNLPGNLIVGTNGGNTMLNILAPGTVTNASGIIGLNATSTNNQVRVENSGAVWQNNGDIDVGYGGSGNQFVVSNGGMAANGDGYVGTYVGADNNLAVVTGTGSLWTNSGFLSVGYESSGNRLVVSNGAVLTSTGSALGGSPGANNNLDTVTGANSQWHNNGALLVGYDDNTNNRVVIRDGGLVVSSSGDIGAYSPGANLHSVLVTDPGSLWTNSDEIHVGDIGSGNQLVVSNNGTVQAANAYVGFDTSSTNNRVTVDGGNLIVTNPSGTAVLDIRRGTNVLNAGLIQADSLLLNNSDGFFNFNGGTLITRGSTVNNGSPFVVGNGSSGATYQLAGNGSHTFNNGLIISTAATLTGNGTVAGPLTIQSGGTLSPGAPVGLLVLNNSPVLQGSVVMEISKSGATLTNDQIQVMAALTYDGSLVVSNLGPDALAIGNSFQLFSATSYDGAFTNVSLPSLNPGLVWTNKLLIDGSIAVVPNGHPFISGVVKSGTNLVFNVSGGSAGGAYTLLTSTNVALPLSIWTTNSTGNFDGLGNTTLTNGINHDEAQRYFNVRVP